MTKIASKLATGLAVLALAAPAFAATATPPAGTAQVQASQSKKHHRVHRRVAQADQKKAGEQKASTKKAAKRSTTAPKAETAPAPAPTPSK